MIIQRRQKALLRSKGLSGLQNPPYIPKPPVITDTLTPIGLPNTLNCSAIWKASSLNIDKNQSKYFIPMYTVFIGTVEAVLSGQSKIDKHRS